VSGTVGAERIPVDANPNGAGEDGGTPIEPARSGRLRRGLGRIETAVWFPVLATIAVSPGNPAAGGFFSLKNPLNLYDEGLLLTLRHFAGSGRLPYRDLFTLYGPGNSLLGPIFSFVAGRQLLVHRLLNLLLLLVLVVGIYRLSRRYVSPWIAAVVASATGLIGVPYHYAMTFACLAWGFHLIAGHEGEPDRRLVSGALLIGLAFMGRHEFAMVSVLILALYWLMQRTRSPSSARTVLLVGTAPVILFAVALLVLVPWNALVENFYDYPRNWYPRPECRGIATPWRDAARSIVAPLFDGVWRARDLVLGLGTYVTPVVGVVAVGLAGRKALRSKAFLLGSFGLIDLFVFASMRPRAGVYPDAALPFTLITVLALLEIAADVRPRWSQRAAAGMALAVAVALSVSFVPGTLASWRTWGSYDPLAGFYDPASPGLGDPVILNEVRLVVQDLVPEGEEIFVALENNTGHFANNTSLYWVTDRPPGSRYFEFDPCLTDRTDVQKLIVADLADVNVVVTTTFWGLAPPFPPSSEVLDRYLANAFEVVAEWPIGPEEAGGYVQRYRVLQRIGSAGS
jgi:hypothetical protein